MNKLEVGMYVRTETGKIGKITNFDGNMARIDTDKFITYKNFHNEIIKASHNIIDLIEEGDYVNGAVVVEIYKNKNGNVEYIDIGDLAININNKEIESIITKEQFKSMEYRLGE